MSMYEYKGYLGSAEVDTASAMLVGKLLFIRDSIGYSANTPAELERAFHEAVDDYLSTCEEQGDDPDVPCKGSFNVRIDPALHRKAAVKSRAQGVTLNQFVEQAIQVACSGKSEHHTHLTLQLGDGPTTRIATAGSDVQWESAYDHSTH